MIDVARRVTTSDAFASGIPLLILGNAAALAATAIPSFEHRYHDALQTFLLVSELLFVAEIAVRVVAEGSLRRFAADPWNRFDAAIVAASLLPIAGPLAPLARLLRVLRVLRLFSAFSAMRDVIRADHVAGPATGPLVALLGMFGFVAALAGHTWFAELDPSRWGDLFLAARSVFYLAVFTDVSAIVGPLTDRDPFSFGYFMLFYAGLASVFLQVLTATLAPAAEPAE